jgi:phosphoribosylformylglycinamidine synthase
MSIPRDLGFDIVTDSEIREDAFLFGEGQGRALVTVNEDKESEFLEFMVDAGVSFTLLGHVTKGKLMVDDEHYGFIAEVKNLYNNALAIKLEQN